VALSAELALAKEISFEDMSAAAQRVAQSEMKGATLKKVENVPHQGKYIYALTLQTPAGAPKYIFLNPDGSYVQDAPAPSSLGRSDRVPTTSSGTQLQLSQLPEAVQRTIQTETKNGPVTRVASQQQQGKNIYEITFHQSNGKDKVIYLNPDGSYAQTRSWDVLGTKPAGVVQAFPSAKQVTFNELPAPVQNAFRTQAGSSRIENIQSGQINGQPVYQAIFNKGGQKVQVRLDSAGRVLGTTQPEAR